MNKALLMMLVAVLTGLLLIGGCSCGGGETVPPGGVAQLKGSESFTVTECKEDNGSYAVTVNKTLTIANITVSGDKVTLPAFEPKSGAPKSYLVADNDDGKTLLSDIEAAVLAVAGGGSIPAVTKEFQPFTFGGIAITIIQPRANSGDNAGGDRRSSSRNDRGDRAAVKAVARERAAENANEERATGGERERGSSASGSSSASSVRPPTVLAEVVLNDGLKITGLRIIKSKNGDGYFISWPSKKQGSKYLPSVALTDAATKKKIDEALLAAYAAEAGLDPAEVKLSERSTGGDEGGDSGDGAPAGDVYISKIEKAGDGFSVTLWNEIVVSGITADGGEIKFPGSESRSRDGGEPKFFAHVRAPFRKAATAVDRLTAAILAFADNGSFEKGTAAELKVTNVHISNGFADVTFNDAIAIHGFHLSGRGEEVKVTLPAVKKGSEFVPVVSFRTAAVWQDIQEQILEKNRTMPQRSSSRSRDGGSSRRNNRGGDSGGDE